MTGNPTAVEALDVLSPDPDDRARFERLTRLLEAPGSGGDDPLGEDAMRVTLDFASRLPSAGDDGEPRYEHETVELPRGAVAALLEIARSLAQGQRLHLVPEGAELTTQAAADLLGVSRPHLIKLIDQGAIAHHMVGTHRRLTSDDVLAYREERNRTRRAAVERAQLLAAELEGGA